MAVTIRIVLSIIDPSFIDIDNIARLIGC